MNPWGYLYAGKGEPASLINEDSLMGDETKEKAMTTQFAGDCDRIMPGKACADCTCGLKEILEGNVTKDQLETGQVESSCGSCYLGDAFRCAGCPFRGQPAFEPGEKVKIVSADMVSAAKDASVVKTDTVQMAATGSSKVVLEL